MKRQTKAILAYGLPQFIKDILQATDEGWEIDDDNPPLTWGFTYEAHMSRSAEITDEERFDRNANLAKARAAKAAKAAEKTAE